MKAVLLLAALTGVAHAQTDGPLLAGPYRVQPPGAVRVPLQAASRSQGIVIPDKPSRFQYKDVYAEAVDVRMRRDLGEHYFQPHISLVEGSHESLALRARHGGPLVLYTFTFFP